MKFFDISVPFHNGMAYFPGTPEPKFTQIKSWEKDDKSLWSLEMTTVTGTHIEAPCHSVQGQACIDQVELEKCFGLCEVVDLTGKDGLISFEEVKDIKAERVLIKTLNSTYIDENRFYDDYIALSKEAAEQLVENGVKLVGIDYYGIEKRGTLDHPVHKALLGNGVVVLVGLNLDGIAPGYYTLSAFPLRLKGMDGSPCRAVLMQE
jgi:arylformamidase